MPYTSKVECSEDTEPFSEMSFPWLVGKRMKEGCSGCMPSVVQKEVKEAAANGS